MKRFAVALLAHAPFLESFGPFLAEVAAVGERAALGQLLLKLTVPGVPDVYQGDELIDLSLVDPDNRRPVDWDERRAALEALQGGAAPTRETMKLHVIARALALRARWPEVFAAGGGYEPIEAGPDVVAFSRGASAEVVVVVVLRGTGDVMVDVPEGTYRDALSGHEHAVTGPAPVPALVDPSGLALLERA